jgi:hypothetical protein
MPAADQEFAPIKKGALPYTGKAPFILKRVPR